MDATRKTTTASGYSNPGSGTSQVAPIMISNTEILSMFNRMEQRMVQQNETNKMFLEQTEKISSQTIRPIDATPIASSVLHPRILNFETGTPSDQQIGGIIPSQPPILTNSTTPSSQAPIFQDLE